MQENAVAGPSSNWQQLKKKLDQEPTPTNGDDRPGKKRKFERGEGELSNAQSSRIRRRESMAAARLAEKNQNGGSSKTQAGTVSVDVPANTKEAVTFLPIPEDVKDRRLIEELRSMIAGENVLNESKKSTGTYIAIDCEMVGTGPMGSTSSLARVSIVNYHGHIILDTFVQPQENITDYRTWISGIKPSDLINAPLFDDVQSKVSALLEGRILVGHALENDLKALLLSHPGPMVRDTQNCKMLREKSKSKRPGLKKLADIELGVGIQKAAHSSVTDARTTMALYRVHKIEWEKQLHSVTESYRQKMGLPSLLKGKGKESSSESLNSNSQSGKRKQRQNGDGKDDVDDPDEFLGKANGKNGGGRKGISSGISTVITHKDGTKEIRGRSKTQVQAMNGANEGGGGGNWWEENPV